MIISLGIFNSNGEKVKSLINKKVYSSKGNYTFNFEASDLTSGNYIYKLEVDGKSISRRMNFVK